MDVIDEINKNCELDLIEKANFLWHEKKSKIEEYLKKYKIKDF
jgi:hypothetical protein